MLKQTLLLIIAGFIAVILLNHQALAISSHNIYLPVMHIQSTSTDKNELLVAKCNKCDVCGKDYEVMGDDNLRSGDHKQAKESYLRAIEAYQESLEKNSENNCVKNGLTRTKVKLKRLK